MEVFRIEVHREGHQDSKHQPNKEEKKHERSFLFHIRKLESIIPHHLDSLFPQ